MTKEKTIAVTYRCGHLSETVIRNRAQLQRRLQRTIEDMVEDGFTSFILPLDERNPFPTTFIDAIEAEKRYNPNIQLLIMLPYEIEEWCAKSPVERLKEYTQCADKVIFNQKRYDPETLPIQEVALLEIASAIMVYDERKRPAINFIAQQIR